MVGAALRHIFGHSDETSASEISSQYPLAKNKILRNQELHPEVTVPVFGTKKGPAAGALIDADHRALKSLYFSSFSTGTICSEFQKSFFKNFYATSFPQIG